VITIKLTFFLCFCQPVFLFVSTLKTMKQTQTNQLTIN